MNSRSPTTAVLAVLLVATATSVAHGATTAFEHVKLIDGTGAAPRPDMTVIVEGARISGVFPDGQAVLPRGAKRIDGTGKFLIPGLMDLHLHVLGGGAWKDSSAQSGKAIDFDVGVSTLQGFLYYGFTTIFDAGNNPDFILPLRERERSGKIVSPRIFATGQLLTYPGSWSVGYAGIAVHDWPETTKELDLQISRKPDLQKITVEARGVGPNPLIPSLPAELLKREIDYLHERGVRAVVHISNEIAARAAIEAGADTLAHIPSVGVITPEFAELAGRSRVPMQTSLSVFDEISNLDAGTDFLRTPEYQATVSAEEIPAREKSRTRYVGLGWPIWFKTILPFAKRNVKMIHDAGGILVLGSDRTFAPSALRELELIVESGINPLEAITIASLNGAIFLDREKDLGSVEEGKLADLVLLNADPTANIRNVREIALVMKNGDIIDRSKLDLPINRARSGRP